MSNAVASSYALYAPDLWPPIVRPPDRNPMPFRPRPSPGAYALNYVAKTPLGRRGRS
ncbi:MAG TPA: hypothetical protein VEJ36_04500 [Nitrososphaerales archaeon]|nr:hypothetical protein [Nitrososphaerales archaeon]